MPGSHLIDPLLQVGLGYDVVGASRENSAGREPKKWVSGRRTKQRDERPSAWVFFPEEPECPEDGDAWVEAVELCQQSGGFPTGADRAFAQYVVFDDCALGDGTGGTVVYGSHERLKLSEHHRAARVDPTQSAAKAVLTRQIRVVGWPSRLID